ncbi:HupE/UreJ family protein [Rhizobium sp. YIM 134829]|uniref:HupE/UreJ family protein n=1 Tax=Rhizobium sp. YIM 134829 TaxID=3390453 RepID=UPI00397999E8
MTRRLTAALSGLALSTLMLSAAPAFAHIDPVAHGTALSDAAHGALHPLSGLDHVLVMVAVGLWAAQRGGRAILAVPAAFVAVMALSFGLALSGLSLPFVEPAILASIVALGLLVAMAVRLPVAAAAGVVAVFALFHGAAHGGELGSADALAFGLGFVVTTAALHLAGIGAGLALARFGSGALARILGGATALIGAALLLGA